MKQLNITNKIWLSVGVFVLGYVLSTALTQIQGRDARASLRTTSEALFPAAQHSQEAEAAFGRMVKGFGDAAVTQDASGIDRAAEDGQQAVAALKAVESVPGLSAERSAEADRLAASVAGILAGGRSTYGKVVAGGMTPEVQGQMQSLASATEETRQALVKTKEQLAADLQQRLASLEGSSASQNSLGLGLFFVTLIVAGVIVHITITRAITGPVIRVIGGVQDAADRTAQTAAEMARSGSEVSDSVQQQAACIEETSASLGEMSVTTRSNADRASQADVLMQGAHQTVERAARAMEELTSSMNLISKSSNQVATVLRNIDEIAFHTNILALNAAVEAARAGEAGAGFSVVADEVRSLAHRAAEAARNSSTIIEKTMTDVARGVVLVQNAHSAFKEVSGTIDLGSQLVSEISRSSQEQAKKIGATGTAISKIESLSMNNAAHAQQTAAGASAMTAQVASTREYLDELVAVVGMHAGA